MANTIKVLGQVNPLATTLTTLYTVPANTATVCSTLIMCNQSALDKVRVAIRPAGATIDPKHYIFYDLTIAANSTTAATVGITLATTDVVTVYAGTANISFSLYGQELSG